MKFSTALKLLAEVNIKYEDNFDFNRSYFEYLKRSKISKMTSYKKKNVSAIKKNGKTTYVISYQEIPIYSSHDDHVDIRASERVDLNTNVFDSIINKAMTKIDAMGMKEGGYRIVSKSLDLVMPMFIYKNRDIKNNFGEILIKGKHPATDNFNECPPVFVELRTVLTKDMYGTEYVKVYSDKSTDTIGVLRHHTDILIERKIPSLIVINI